MHQLSKHVMFKQGSDSTCTFCILTYLYFYKMFPSVMKSTPPRSEKYRFWKPGKKSLGDTIGGEPSVDDKDVFQNLYVRLKEAVFITRSQEFGSKENR